MSRNKKTEVVEQLPMELLATRPALPQLVEYLVEGVVWRVARFDLLVVEMGQPQLAVESLPELHHALCSRERPWLVVRRLFGFMPQRLPKDYPVDDMRLWDRLELMEAIGITRAQLQQELDGVRGMWAAMSPGGKPEPEAVSVLKGTPGGEFRFADDELLREYDFRVSFPEGFEAKEWFIRRVRQFEKLLRENMTSGLARNTLMTELQLRRLDETLADPAHGRMGGADWRSGMKLRGELDKTYQDQLAALNKLAPWASELTGKYSFAGTLSDVTRSMMEYHSSGDTTLADGIFTLTEIRVECRRSVQMSEPRYRAGLVVYLNMAKAFLFDPKFKSAFLPGQFKKLDAGWKGAFVEAETAAGVPVPDLAGEDEYEKLGVNHEQ